MTNIVTELVRRLNAHGRLEILERYLLAACRGPGREDLVPTPPRVADMEARIERLTYLDSCMPPAVRAGMFLDTPGADTPKHREWIEHTIKELTE